MPLDPADEARLAAVEAAVTALEAAMGKIDFSIRQTYNETKAAELSEE